MVELIWVVGRAVGTGTFGKVVLARLARRVPPPAQALDPLTPAPTGYFAMKVLEKVTVVRLRQVEHLNSERSTLASVSHPFVVNLSVPSLCISNTH